MRFTATLMTFGLMLTACGDSTLNNDEIAYTENEQALLAQTIDFADKECIAQGQPIAIVFKNGTEQPTSSFRWHFAVNRVNHSNNLTNLDLAKSFNDPSRRTDRIIQPGESYKVCSSPPEITNYDFDSNELQYSVIINDDRNLDVVDPDVG